LNNNKQWDQKTAITVNLQDIGIGISPGEFVSGAIEAKNELSTMKRTRNWALILPCSWRESTVTLAVHCRGFIPIRGINCLLRQGGHSYGKSRMRIENAGRIEVKNDSSTRELDDAA
jgi:hypothetical protein